METLEVLDSHTEGEPTRVVLRGAPDLGEGDARQRAERFAREYTAFRRAVVCEPRGHEAIVGALLLEAQDPAALAQVIFFNNVDCLGMCVHGTIGVAKTLAHLGRAGPGRHRLETPVGEVSFELLEDGRVAVENVPSRRSAKDVEFLTQEHGRVRGDVAWGGNWFFLLKHVEAQHSVKISARTVDALTRLCWDIRQSLKRVGLRGSDGAEIDHVEVFGPPTRADAASKNFVLCPGKAWDRSPCGTGTSAKLACLAADASLEEGQSYGQESTIGTLFEASWRAADVAQLGAAVVAGTGPWIVPTIVGRAYMTGEATLLRDARDPFVDGFPVP